VDDIFAEVRAHFLLLLVSVVVRSFIQAVVASERLSFSLGILLEQQRRCSDLLVSTVPANSDCHTALLSIQHQVLLRDLLLNLDP
jgi:hypothetical protein